MKKGGFHPECLFYAYFEHASCYAALGKKDECQRQLSQLIEKNLCPTLDDLKARGYKVNRQPCFHYAQMSEEDKLIIDTVTATTVGNDIVNSYQQNELVPKLCPCQDKDIESCKRWCVRIGSLATYIVGFISNISLRLTALTTLIEIQFECFECCEQGFGNEDCFKKLKLILNPISEIGNGVMMDRLP